MDPVRARNRRGEGDRLRDELVAAAQALVDAAIAPSVLTLRGVARQAGISAPSIYAHFDDLQAILDVVLERDLAELDTAIAGAMIASRPDDRLIDGCLAYVRYGWEYRSRFRFMFSGSGFAPDALVTLLRIQSALQECIDTGLSASDDASNDTFLLWVGMHGMAVLQKPDRAELRRLGPLDRPELAERLARRIARLHA